MKRSLKYGISNFKLFVSVYKSIVYANSYLSFQSRDQRKTEAKTNAAVHKIGITIKWNQENIYLLWVCLYGRPANKPMKWEYEICGGSLPYQFSLGAWIS